jgi:hypothetical protein
MTDLLQKQAFGRQQCNHMMLLLLLLLHRSCACSATALDSRVEALSCSTNRLRVGTEKCPVTDLILCLSALSAQHTTLMVLLLLLVTDLTETI